MNSNWLYVFAPLFLAGQGLLIHFAAGDEKLPTTPMLSRLPGQIGVWSELRDDPFDQDLVSELQADQVLNRIYVNRPSGSLGTLFLAWFASQREGRTQPHSPKVCLPASGWFPESSGELNIATPAAVITANRYVVFNGNQRAVVLYWYQTPQRAIASEWASKFWTMADALRYHRTDTALVRIVVWSAVGGEQAATETARNFAENLYPILRQHLPH